MSIKKVTTVILIGPDYWHGWQDVIAHGTAHKDDKQVTTATEHVLSSTEGARQPPATKKTGRSRWNCWMHIKGMASKGRKWCIEHEIFPKTFSTLYKGNEDWLLSSFFQTPLYLPFSSQCLYPPIFALVFPLHGLWIFFTRFQKSPHIFLPKTKLKAEHKWIRGAGLETQRAKEIQQSWGHLTEDTKAAILPYPASR